MAMRLQGHAYAVIGDKLGVSRQRIQQIIGPPRETREIVCTRSKGRCVDCNLRVGISGHIHHRNGIGVALDDYNDIDNLVLLCIPCHLRAHNPRTVGPPCVICGLEVRHSRKQRPRHNRCHLPRTLCSVCGEPIESATARMMAWRRRTDSRYHYTSAPRHRRCLIRTTVVCRICHRSFQGSARQRYHTRQGQGILCSPQCDKEFRRLGLSRKGK